MSQRLMAVEKWFTELFMRALEPGGSIYFCPYDTWPAGPKLGHETVLFSASVDTEDDILRVVIHELPAASGFTYVSLVKAINHMGQGNQKYVFFISNPDNCLSLLLSFVELNDWTPETLNLFCAEPSIQGGNCYLGMVDDTQSWMLVHEFCPGNHFTVYLHAAPESSAAVIAELGARDVPGRRLL